MSDLFYHSTGFLLKVLESLLKTNIRVHGIENLPASSPTLFVANHFTRFETIVLPYVITQHTGQSVRSLADKSLYVGLLKYYLEETGTLSTANKHRNEIIIGDLVTGRKNWIVFPEGNMIKNKKITKADEFIIHTPERKGSIHTGAAMLSLKSQLLKIEYNLRKKMGEADFIKEFREKYFLEADEKPAYRSTVIVPVTITHTPLRPGGNPMMKMVSLFAGDDMSSKVMEELEIEGNLLSSGEMHICFDKPIDMAAYIHEAKKRDAEMSRGPIRHYYPILQNYKHRLTTRFMGAIYKNVMITFDHIFASVLEHYPNENIALNDLKLAIFIVANDVVNLQIYYTHEVIDEALIDLIGEEEHLPFKDVMELAQKQHILSEAEPYRFHIRKAAFRNEYRFHEIRIKNTLRVLYHEVALLDTFQESVEHNLQKKPCEIAEEIFHIIYNRDRDVFKADYNRFYSVFDSRPKKIGMPFVLFNPEYSVGIVLAHGYKSAPEEVRELAEYLHAREINVYAVRLKGHGTLSEDLRDSTHEEWYASFNMGYTAMRQVCKHLFLGGFSSGGLLALLAGSRKTAHVDGIVCINSAMKLHDIRVRYVVPTMNALNDFLALFNANVEYIESESENPTINYRRNYLRSVVELQKLMNLTHKSLSKITVPTLVVQGKDDPVVKPESAQIIMNGIQSSEKELYMPERSRHVIITGEASEEIFETVEKFIKQRIKPRRRENDA